MIEIVKLLKAKEMKKEGEEPPRVFQKMFEIIPSLKNFLLVREKKVLNFNIGPLTAFGETNLFIVSLITHLLQTNYPSFT